MSKIILISLLSVLALSSAQRITTIHLDGVQYFISRMNPYSPELNYFLAYQYCRSLGLQLASFETKEKAESMTMYLKNAGYGNYDFWTSGNRLGTGMFLWMSTGLPFNATFDFFENSSDAIQAGLMDPIHHNSNTSPQRTARDSSSGADKGCVILKQPTLKWMPEDCSAVKDFICEQTRCYYYNYGSIPVSSAQGRPITSTTARPSSSTLKNLYASTTPLPVIMSTYATLARKAHQEEQLLKQQQQPSFDSLKLDHEHLAVDTVEEDTDPELVDADTDSDAEADATAADSSSADVDDDGGELEAENEHEMDKTNNDDSGNSNNTNNNTNNISDGDNYSEEQRGLSDAVKEESLASAAASATNELHHDIMDDDVDDESAPHLSAAAAAAANDDHDMSDVSNSPEDAIKSPTVIHADEEPTVEVRIKQISKEIEKMTTDSGHPSHQLLMQQHPHPMHNINHDNDDIGRQSFLSLSDLIRTFPVRPMPNNKQHVPQIHVDSDYSAQRVLGETAALMGNDEAIERGQARK